MARGETAVLVVTARTLNCCLSSLRWFCTVSRMACSSPRRLSSACLSCSSFPLSRASARRRRSSAFATLLRHRVCAGAQPRSETRPQTAQALEQAIEGSGGRGACDGASSCCKGNVSNPFCGLTTCWDLPTICLVWAFGLQNNPIICSFFTQLCPATMDWVAQEPVHHSRAKADGRSVNDRKVNKFKGLARAD